MKTTLPFTKEQALNWRRNCPTPFYVYDEKEIISRTKALQQAFSWNEGFTEYFAVKAAPTPAILRLLASLGCGADCASAAELELAKRSGMKMIFTSNETRGFEYEYARSCGAIINLDDITQIENLEKSAGIPDTVCLRYNAGKMHFANEFIGDSYDAKFGMTHDQIIEGIRLLKEKGTVHFGLHSMQASCCLDESYYGALAEELFSLALEIKEKYSIKVEFIDLAGGIGIPYRPGEKEADIGRIGESVRKVYEKMLIGEGLCPAVFTELGRYITGPAGYLVSSVVGCKHTYKEFVGLDASACDHMRPAMYGAYHHINILGKEDMPKKKVDVCGPLCENNDKFAVDRLLPETEAGDIAVIQDSGAHCRSMGYNYNSRLRCAEFMLKEDGSLKMIRRAETMADYFATLDIDELF